MILDDYNSNMILWTVSKAWKNIKLKYICVLKFNLIGKNKEGL